MKYDKDGKLIRPDHYVDDAGLCMHCNKHAFLGALDLAADVNDRFVYVEIGVFNGETMRWVCDHLTSTGRKWTAFGVELPQWESGNMMLAANKLGGYWSGHVISTALRAGDLPVPDNKVVMFLGGSGAFLHDSGITPSFVFIDGCHSYKCCTMDLLMTEVIMPSGGVVAIHDVGDLYQDVDFQPHCDERLKVRQACKDLGLLDDKRTGWHVVDITEDDMDNHACLFALKT